MPCFRALHKAIKRNIRLARAGKRVTVGGKTMAASTYKRKYGLPKRKR